MAHEPISFALADIETLQFALFEENISTNKNTPLSLKTQVEFGMGQLEKILRVAITFNFEQAKKPLIKLKVRCDYVVSEETWGFYSKDGAISFPVGFMRHLGVICIGTSRGIIHVKTENTKFNDFLLPIINVEELISDDVSFSLEEE